MNANQKEVAALQGELSRGEHLNSLQKKNIGEEEVKGRGTKTIMASWHYHPKSFCASGKFLRVTLEIALGTFRMVWKVFG